MTQTAECSADIGMAGLGVMGASLVRNIRNHGFAVAAWERSPKNFESFVEKLKADPEGAQVCPTEDPRAFVMSLKRPRRIMMMVKAGAPVDWTIEQFTPFLEAGDILIDGGNSHFDETERRERDLAARGFHFVGMGVSGGERGALEGPSMMPGGSVESYAALHKIWEAIAAKTDSGACVTHVGAGGAGHFVKMVHNGIEYGDMQLIAEAYDILHRGLGMETDELADTFAEWNRGALESYLIEITAGIFTVKDSESGKPLVDLVLDRAGQKGTGKWTAQVALDLGVAIPTIAAAIDARVLSSMKAEREAASGAFDGMESGAYNGIATTDRAEFVRAVRDALYASKICSYAQGMNLIRAGSTEYKWNINLRETARIWKGGCIIRARFLDRIMAAYERDPTLANLLLDEEFKNDIRRTQAAWRKVVTTAQSLGIPVLAMAASLNYFDSYRTGRLPQNLTQAQRDYFGAHTYERLDRPEAGAVHTDWETMSAK